MHSRNVLYETVDSIGRVDLSKNMLVPFDSSSNIGLLNALHSR